LPLFCLVACSLSALPDAGQPFTTPGPQTTTTPTSVATPTSTATLPPTPMGNPAGIPTIGTTANGCAITPAQAQAEAYVAKLVNQHRSAAGVPALTLNQTLSLASRTHSCDMELHRHLTHTGSDGSTPGDRIAATGLKFTRWGENIGRCGDRDPLSGIAQVDAAMMAEPLTQGNHHWNIVNPAYTQLGVGVIDAGGAVYFTEDFGG
jgi:uncharacterized protein YkwD